MTTYEAIAAIGSWNIGGVYTEEDSSQVQGRLLNMLNVARLKVMEMNYMRERYLSQEYYQKYEALDIMEGSCKGEFVFYLVSPIASVPEPKRNGMDGIFMDCDTSRPLTEIGSETLLRQYKTHTHISALVKHGVYVRTGLEIMGYALGNKKPSKLLIRAIFSDPTKLPNFNINTDPYPAPDGFLSDVKKLLLSDEGRKSVIPPDNISNSKNDMRNAGAR